MARPKSSSADVAQRKQQIVAGARHCFAVYGFDGATVERLERHCGLTRGTLFRYYRSKAAMLTAVVAAEEAAQQPQYEAVLAAAGRGQADALQAALLLQLQRVGQDPVPTRLRLELLALSRRDQRWAARIQKLEQQQRAWRRSLIAQAFARGKATPDAVIEPLTDALSVIFFGLATTRALGAPTASSDRALVRSLAALVRSALDGAR